MIPDWECERVWLCSLPSQTQRGHAIGRFGARILLTKAGIDLRSTATTRLNRVENEGARKPLSTSETKFELHVV
jgi:hypothetical protein